MPGSTSFFEMREILKLESLQAMLGDEGLVEGIKTPHGLLDVVDRVLPDLPGVEREWLGQIPRHLREAVRAVIASVALDDDEAHLDLQYEPAYDFSVKVYQFDKAVVVRVSGPHG
jgi:hypothetical protein